MSKSGARGPWGLLSCLQISESYLLEQTLEAGCSLVAEACWRARCSPASWHWGWGTAPRWWGERRARALEKSQNSSAAVESRCRCRLLQLSWCCPWKWQCRISPAEVPVRRAGLSCWEPRCFAFVLGAGAAYASVLLSSLARPRAPVWGLFPQHTAPAEGANVGPWFYLGREGGYKCAVYPGCLLSLHIAVSPWDHVGGFHPGSACFAGTASHCYVSTASLFSACYVVVI